MQFFTISSEPKLIRNFQCDVLDWTDVIDNLNYTIDNHLFFKKFENYGFVTHNGYTIPKCRTILNLIYKNNLDHPKEAFTAHIYTSFTTLSATFDEHIDATTDVWFWQCIGITKWEFTFNSNKIEELLFPGDILFIPKGIPHKTTPMTPRSGVSFGLEHDKKEYNIENF